MEKVEKMELSDAATASPAGSAAAPNPSRGAVAKSYSCDQCRKRKTKCDKSFPCTACVKSQINCTQAAATSIRPRKKRFPEAELLARIRLYEKRLLRYEAALKQHGVDLESLKSGEVVVAREAKGTKQIDAASSPGESLRSLSVDDEDITLIKDELNETEDILRGSSEDELDPSPIMSTFSKVFRGDGGGIIFGNANEELVLASMHPGPNHIFGLWQAFLVHADPLTKMIHAPTLQQDIIKASTNLAATPNSMHALMFAIYSMAVRAISDEECLSTYQDDKGKLITRYNAACQEALRRAEVLRSGDVEVLRAFVLYLISAIHILDPRSLFALTAMADRIGRRLGLHSEAAYRRMSPLQGQLAKRVWWNILVYERRLAELSGAGPSILPNVWTARLPLNVNDSNLNATMTTPPKEQSVATDMIFCLTRFEVAEFLRAHRSAHTSEALWQEFGELNISDTEKDKSIDAFERRMEEKYMRHCDMQIPMHQIAICYLKMAILKMRFNLHYPRGPRGAPPSAESLEYIFRISVEMLETYIVAINSKAVVHFDWYLSTNKPLIPLVHVLSILRTNTHGDLANRAWAAIMRIGDIFPRPAHSLTQVDNPMFLAFANLKVKAWEAREEYFRRSAPLPTPSAIANLKERLALRRKMMDKPDASTSPYSGSDTSRQTQGNARVESERGMVAGTSSNFDIVQGLNADPSVLDPSLQVLPMDMDPWIDPLDGFGLGSGFILGYEQQPSHFG